MSQSRILCTVIVLIGLANGIANATDVPPLDKKTAEQILGFAGYTNLVVGAVLNRVAAVYGPSDSVATVLGVGKLSNENTKIEKLMFYDADLGWFMFAFRSDKTQALRIWTVKGYREIQPSSQ